MRSVFRRGLVSISKHLHTEVCASVAEEDDGRGVEKANQISLEFLEAVGSTFHDSLEPRVRPPHMTPVIPPPSYPLATSPLDDRS
jgi:hypothetical protein